MRCYVVKIEQNLVSWMVRGSNLNYLFDHGHKTVRSFIESLSVFGISNRMGGNDSRSYLGDEHSRSHKFVALNDWTPNFQVSKEANHD